jgi:parallel beta-helix repeat protein
MLNKKTILIVFMLASSTLIPYFATRNLVGLSSPETTIHVEPDDFYVPVCDTFDINVSVTDVIDLYNYKFSLHYDTTILDALEVSEDRFLNEDKWRHFDINDDIGKVQVEAGSIPPAEPASEGGNATLVTIKFRCTLPEDEQSRVSAITFLDHVLKDREGNPILHGFGNSRCTVGMERRETKKIFEDYRLCHDTNSFCEVGFEICSDNVELDLGGHMISVTSIDPPPGAMRIGVLVEQGKTGVTITNGKISHFQYGIQIVGSDNVTVSDITISNCNNVGIEIRSSDNITITNTTVKQNRQEGVHIYEGSSYITLKNNTLSENGMGVWIDNSEEWVVTGNTIEKNGGAGVYISNSDNNTIVNNTMSNNGGSGIRLHLSSKNKIYHNNFVDNGEQAFDDGDNIWNQDYPHCGNYWSKYTGEDHYCGVDQDIAFRDGLGDEAYIIDTDSQDQYPLVEPWGSTYWVDDYYYRLDEFPFAIHSSSSVTDIVIDLKNKPGQIDFIINSSDTSGFCNAIICGELISGTFCVLIDNVTIRSILTRFSCMNETYTLIHFTYENDIHNVQIVGEVPYDLNGDGIINIIDLSILAKYWQK